MTFSQDIERAVNRQLLELTTGSLQIREPLELLRIVQKVREQFSGGKAGICTPDRLEAAIASLLRGIKPSRRQLLFLAHGFSRPVKALSGRSLLDSKHGTDLLGQWESQTKSRSLSPLHWKGLFRSFMQAEAGVGADRLRALLSNAAVNLPTNWRKPPPWWEALGRHQSLLSNSPCQGYMEEMLDEGTELLDDLRANIDVPPGSWFWSHLAQAVREGLDDLSDVAFRSKIPYLLTLPSRIPGSRDEILAAVLGRYAECESRSRHAELLQFALEAWRSPQLRSNNLWELAGTPAKHMVCGWLAEEDLEDFYQVCRGQTQVDERRLKFWLRFTKQMDYTQILLGSEIRSSRNTDVRDFISKKKGRLGDLTSGSSSNNAILMQIGGWIFIEFSEIGNACYGYPVSGGHIQLGRSKYSLDDLKRKGSASSWLTHMDGHLSWEQKFLTELSGKGVFPDGEDTTLPRQPSPATPQQVARGTPAFWRAGAPSPRVEDRSKVDVIHEDRDEFLMRSLKALNVGIVDNRRKGGALWAYLKLGKAPHEELKALGLIYKAARNGYYLP
jgi:hypothetical protein